MGIHPSLPDRTYLLAYDLSKDKLTEKAGWATWSAVPPSPSSRRAGRFTESPSDGQRATVQRVTDVVCLESRSWQDGRAGQSRKRIASRASRRALFFGELL
jgi:hypothetical protein